MPAIPFNSGIDLQKVGEIQNGKWQVLPSAPSSPVLGQTYYDSTLNKTGTWNGTSWDYSNSQTINNATITIQKNSTTVESFTLNQSTDEVINITVPTQASDVGALPANTTINDLTSTAQQNAINSGITSALVTQIGTNQTNINTINSKIPSEATSTNKLADKAYVDNAVSTNAASFDGSWATYAAIPSTVAGFTVLGLPEPSNNNYLIVTADETQDGGTWRYKYVDDGTAYNKDKWQPEYEIEKTPLTPAQQAALDSGITSTLVTQIGTNQSDISTLQTAVATKADAFALTNPALTVSGGVCTWSITNSIGTKDVQVAIYRETDGVEVKTYVAIGTSTITVSFNSTANISAGTYRAVIIGLKQ